MKADLHIHTKYSYDAVSSPQEVVKVAIERSIDCICITDHGEIRGAIEAMRFGFDKDILVIPGIEILTTSGDILGINVKEIIPDGLSTEKTIQEIKKQGGLAVVAHPFDWSRSFWGKKKDLLSLGLDAFEAFNAVVISRRSNKRALNFVQKNNLCFTAGSDAHRAEFVGRGYIETLKDIGSEKELLEEIKNRRVEIKGVPLNLWEMLKNGSSTDFLKMIKFYNFKRKNNKN